MKKQPIRITISHATQERIKFVQENNILDNTSTQMTSQIGEKELEEAGKIETFVKKITHFLTKSNMVIFKKQKI